MKHTDTHHSPLPTGYVALCLLAKQMKGKSSIPVPVKTVRQMLEAYEDMLDVVAYDAARQHVEEYFPKQLVDRLIAGENRLRVYREYRVLTQRALADASGVSRDMIAMIETNKKQGSLRTVKKLAAALKVSVEDIVA